MMWHPWDVIMSGEHIGLRLHGAIVGQEHLHLPGGLWEATPSIKWSRGYKKAVRKRFSSVGNQTSEGQLHASYPIHFFMPLAHLPAVNFNVRPAMVRLYSVGDFP